MHASSLFPGPLGYRVLWGLGLLGWSLLPLHAVDPSAAEDAAIERQKILKAADQMELLVQQNEQIRAQLQELRADVDKLRAENAELKKQGATLEKNHAAEREALLKEVSAIVASGKTTSSAGRTTPPPSPSPSPASGEGFEHVVQPGQSLWAIAKAFQDQGIKVSAEDIRIANHLKDNNLHAGQKLFIPKK